MLLPAGLTLEHAQESAGELWIFRLSFGRSGVDSASATDSQAMLILPVHRPYFE